jgi:hypothetical protein
LWGGVIFANLQLFGIDMVSIDVLKIFSSGTAIFFAVSLFRKQRPCSTQLIEVLEDWTEKIDNYNSIDTIYLDFQKAFDTVPHIRLLSKLEGNLCHIV